MDIKWIEDFLALVEHGSYTKAAEIRHVTQSGLSRRIRSLEYSIGVDLVQKNVYPTTLTSAGLEHVEDMRLLINQYYDLQLKINESDKQNKMLTLTTQHALSICFFPHWYRGIRTVETRPCIRVNANDFHDGLVTFLAEQCDFLLCYYSPDICPELIRQGIQSVQVGADQLIPVALTGSGFCNVAEYPLAIPLIGYPSESFFGRLLQQELRDKLSPAYQFDLVVETAMSDSIKSMVLQGVGISWLPKAMVQERLNSGELTKIEGLPALEMKIMLYRHKVAKNAEVDAVWDSLTTSDV